MTIVWLDEAERDLAAIADYVLQDDPTAAWRLVDTSARRHGFRVNIPASDARDA